MTSSCVPAAITRDRANGRTMTTHLIEIEDERGDLIDQHWTCSVQCYRDATYAMGIERDEPAAWPCGPSEADYDQYCAGCGVLIGIGLQSPRTTASGEPCWSCPPVTVGLLPSMQVEPGEPPSRCPVCDGIDVVAPEHVRP